MVPSYGAIGVLGSILVNVTPQNNVGTNPYTTMVAFHVPTLLDKQTP
jgi:hypothetical protein